MERKPNAYIFYPLRAVTMALFILIIRQITNRRFLAMINDPMTVAQIPRSVIYLFAIICTALITNSVVNLFTVYDKGQMYAFLDKKRQEVSFVREIKEILCDKFFYIEVLPHMALTALFVCLDLYGEFTYAVSAAGILKRGVFGYAMVSLLCAAMVFAISLLTRYEARRYWHHLKNKKSLSTLSGKPLLIFKGVLIFALYPIAAPYMPYLVYMLFTLVGLVVTIANTLTTLGLILAVILLVVLLKLIGSLKYKTNKRKIIREITALAKEEGYEYRLYEGERRDEEGCDLLLTKDEKSYSVRIIKPRSRRLPLYFTERDAYFLYKIGTKNHYRALESHFDYTFDAVGERIILLPEIPKYLFVKEADVQKRLFAGDRIWGYIIYEPKSFLGNLSRDCLGRANNDRS